MPETTRMIFALTVKIECAPDARAAPAMQVKAASGGVIEPVGQPHFDQRLPRDTPPFRLCIKPVHHPAGKIDIDALGLPPGPAGGGPIDIRINILAIVKQAVKFLSADRFDCHGNIVSQLAQNFYSSLSIVEEILSCHCERSAAIQFCAILDCRASLAMTD